MFYIRLCFGLLLLALTLYGNVFCIAKGLKTKAEFAPIIAFSCIGCFMLFAGILNMLQLGTIVLVLNGLVWTAVALKTQGALSITRQPVAVGVVIASAFYFLYFWDKFLLSWDHFTHWAVVSKVLLVQDRLPCFLDTIIGYPSYPPGLASFIYFVCKVLGVQRDNYMLFAQMLLLIACPIPLFALCRKNRIASYIVIALSAALCLSSIRNGTSIFEYGGTIRTLYADLPLPMFTIAGGVIAFYYRDTIEDRWYLLLPILCFLPLIKNSGIYFVLLLAVQLIIYLFCRRTHVSGLRILKACVLTLCIPILVIYAWNQHVTMVFEGALLSRHAFSLEYFLRTFRAKSDALNRQTVAQFFALLKDYSIMKDAMRCGAMVALTAIIGTLTKVKTAFSTRKYLIVTVCIYVSYLLGMLGMYLFSMPEGLLGSFTRYETTIHPIIIALTAVYIILILNDLPAAGGWLRIAALLAPLVVMAVLCRAGIRDLFVFPEEGQASAKHMVHNIEEVRYAATPTTVYIPTNSYDETRVCYYFYPATPNIVNEKTLDSLDDWTENSQYLMIYKADEAYLAFAEEQGIDPTVEIWGRSEYLDACRAPE